MPVNVGLVGQLLQRIVRSKAFRKKKVEAKVAVLSVEASDNPTQHLHVAQVVPYEEQAPWLDFFAVRNEKLCIGPMGNELHAPFPNEVLKERKIATVQHNC
jgi:hypothetical protein